MKLTITINMDGAAFEDNKAGELIAIFDTMSKFAQHVDGLFYEVAIRDTNGNRCGKLVVTEEDEPSEIETRAMRDPRFFEKLPNGNYVHSLATMVQLLKEEGE